MITHHLMFHPDDDEACPMCSSIVDLLPSGRIDWLPDDEYHELS